jgi:hypothetical protein
MGLAWRQDGAKRSPVPIVAGVKFDGGAARQAQTPWPLYPHFSPTAQ